MDVERLSTLPARIVLWQSGVGQWRVTVVSKVSYVLQPGVAQMKDESFQLIFEDEHLDGDPTCSVYAPGDLVPAKPRADVVLTGSAYAPEGKPVDRLVASLIVGEISKSVVVTGWRAVAPDGTTHDAGPFSSMRLSYEAAAGGPGTDNPVGMHPGACDSYGRVLLPTIYKENQEPAKGKVVDPVGFGAIGRDWPSRRACLGRHQDNFPVDNWRGRPLPADFDMSYFNAAPSDQQLTALSPSEAIVLHNLDATNATLITRLAGMQPAVFIAERNGQRLPMRADTLWIDSDRGIASLTFRADMEVPGPKEELTFVVAAEHVDRPLSWQEVQLMRTTPSLRIVSAATHGSRTLDIAMLEEHTGLIKIPVRAPLPFVDSGNESSTRGPAAGQESAPSNAGLPFDNQAEKLDPLLSTRSNWSPAAVVRPVADEETASVSPGLPPPALPPPAAPPQTAPPPAAPGPPPPAPTSRSSAGASPWADGAAAGLPAAAVPLVPMRNDPLTKKPSDVAAAHTPAPAPAVSPAAGPNGQPDLLSLLWLHPDCASRLRRVKAYKPIFEALEKRTVDWELDDGADGDDSAHAEDRREVFEVIAKASPVGAAGLDAAVKAGSREDGKFVPQVVVLKVDLATPFDAKERLKAVITTVTPLLTSNGDDADGSELGQAVADAERFLGAADELIPQSILDGFSQRIQRAFEAEDRALPNGYLVDETDRVLLNHRKYDQRIVLGDDHLRTLSHFAGEPQPVPTYLPLELAKKLPLYRRFKVRLIAEVLLQEDEHESHPQALRALAVARILPR